MKWSMICRADKTGLGIQTRGIAENLKPNKVLLVDISELNGNEQFPEWYDGLNVRHCKGFPKKEDIEWLLEGMDLFFTCEIPYNYYIFERARELGVKTILQLNPEFFDYFQTPDLPKPDLFACPSMWMYSQIPDPKILLFVPCDTKNLPQQKIKQFRKFLHIAGIPAIHDRNGTLNTIQAFQKVRAKGITLTIKAQKKLDEATEKEAAKDRRITIDYKNPDNYTEIYDGFDCLIFPRKFGGNCMPMNEALGCGIPVIMTDISPNNEFLTWDWMIKANPAGSFMARTEIPIFEVDISALAAKITELAGLDSLESKLQGQYARDMGTFLSWDKRKKQYLEIFNDLIKK